MHNTKRTIHETTNRTNRNTGRRVIKNHGERVIRDPKTFDFYGEEMTVGKVTIKGSERLTTVSTSKYGVSMILGGSSLTIIGDIYNSMS